MYSKQLENSTYFITSPPRTQRTPMTFAARNASRRGHSSGRNSSKGNRSSSWTAPISADAGGSPLLGPIALLVVTPLLVPPSSKLLLAANVILQQQEGRGTIPGSVSYTRLTLASDRGWLLLVLFCCGGWEPEDERPRQRNVCHTTRPNQRRAVPYLPALATTITVQEYHHESSLCMVLGCSRARRQANCNREVSATSQIHVVHTGPHTRQCRRHVPQGGGTTSVCRRPGFLLPTPIHETAERHNVTGHVPRQVNIRKVNVLTLFGGGPRFHNPFGQ